MNLPKIDIESLPNLDSIAGVFGSAQGPGSDDSIIIIMVYVYERIPPEGFAGALL